MTTAAQLPETEHSPLLRNDFTDDEAWQALLGEIESDWVKVMADPGHRDLSVPDWWRWSLTAAANRCSSSRTT